MEDWAFSVSFYSALHALDEVEVHLEAVDTLKLDPKGIESALLLLLIDLQLLLLYSQLAQATA